MKKAKKIREHIVNGRWEVTRALKLSRDTKHKDLSDELRDVYDVLVKLEQKLDKIVFS